MRRRSRPRIGAAPLALALLGAVACDAFRDPLTAPATARPFVAPSLYGAWWRATEQCAGLRAPMSDVAWYTVPGEQFEDSRGALVRGTWQGRGADRDRIYLVEAGQFDGMLVRHEMLHAILARNYRAPGHAREFFLARCGGIVSCGDACVREAGGSRVPAEAREVEAGALQRSITLSTIEGRPDRDSGWVAVTVAARNPHPYPVWVVVPPSPDVFPTAHFGLRIEFSGFESVPRADLGTRVAIAPGESVGHVFDVHTSRLRTGLVRVRGNALGDSTDAVTLHVAR